MLHIKSCEIFPDTCGDSHLVVLCSVSLLICNSKRFTALCERPIFSIVETCIPFGIIRYLFDGLHLS